MYFISFLAHAILPNEHYFQLLFLNQDFPMKHKTLPYMEVAIRRIWTAYSEPVRTETRFNSARTGLVQTRTDSS